MRAMRGRWRLQPLNPLARALFCGVVGAAPLLEASRAPGAENRRGGVLTIIEENDLVVKTDRHYTQGLRLTLLLQERFPRWADDWFSRVPLLGMSQPVNRFGVALGQNLYTPLDLNTSAVARDDRPYAAWLYLGAIWQRRGSFNERVAGLDSAEIDLGLVGKGALGEEAQVWVHQIRGLDLPQGWRHQLQNEPAVQLRLARQWRVSAGGRQWLAADWIPELGCSLGNVATTLNAGATFRFGFNLPDDFGVRTIDSLPSNSHARDAVRRRQFGLYGFAGIEARLVGYTTFLDGNMFRASHRIAKQFAVADVRLGCVAVFKYCDIWFAYVMRSREFVGQKDANGFGSAGISVKF
jgi:hypothetical protein